MQRPTDDSDQTVRDRADVLDGEPAAEDAAAGATAPAASAAAAPSERPGEPEPAASQARRPRAPREVTGEHGARRPASMIFWLVVLAAVGVGVSLYFLFGRAIVPLLGPQQ